MRVYIAAASLLALALAGCSSTPSGDGHTDIALRDNSFSPATLSTSVGQTVEFHNEGARTHTVTMHVPSGAAAKDTQLNAGGQTEYTFSKAGTYHVYCKIHSDSSGNGMDMTVTVA